jgi:hypothetical protein
MNSRWFIAMAITGLALALTGCAGTYYSDYDNSYGYAPYSYGDYDYGYPNTLYDYDYPSFRYYGHERDRDYGPNRYYRHNDRDFGRGERHESHERGRRD